MTHNREERTKKKKTKNEDDFSSNCWNRCEQVSKQYCIVLCMDLMLINIFHLTILVQTSVQTILFPRHLSPNPNLLITKKKNAFLILGKLSFFSNDDTHKKKQRKTHVISIPIFGWYNALCIDANIGMSTKRKNKSHKNFNLRIESNCRKRDLEFLFSFFFTRRSIFLHCFLAMVPMVPMDQPSNPNSKGNIYF